MDVGVYSYHHGDPLLIDKIVNEFLSQGKFDKLRKECMSDADTKPAYQNLQQRVENTVTQFLKKQVWRPDLNKNQLRDSLRKHVLESKFFDAGINRIVDQVVNPNLLATVFLPEVEEVVYNYLSIPRPSERNYKRGASDERFKSFGREYEYKTSQGNEKFDKIGLERYEGGTDDQRRENHLQTEDYKIKDIIDRKPSRGHDFLSDAVKIEPSEDGAKPDERMKSEPEDHPDQMCSQISVDKMEITSDESQESLNRMAAENLHLSEPDGPPIADSDDSIPLEINEKSMSESRDSEDSIMNQMSPISQGRLTPELEEELLGGDKSEEKSEEKVEEKMEEKKPLTFIGRIPKIKREDSESSKSSKTKEDTARKEKLDVKIVYSSDESDSSKSYGKSDSDEKRKKNEKSSKDERKRDDSEKKPKERSSREEKRERSRDRHKDHRRERSRDRHKKSSSSSSSSQRERSSSHHKSSHRHKDSRSKRKEEEKKKSKSTDDHGKERIKKEDRRSTDRDSNSNERERDRSSGSRVQGESRKREEQQKTEEGKGEGSQKEEKGRENEEEILPIDKGERVSSTAFAQSDGSDSPVLDFNELYGTGALSRQEFPKLTDDFYVKFNSTGFRYFEEWEKAKLDCEEEFKEFVDEAENDLSLLSDDESECEFENDFREENKKTITNLLKGLGNFRDGLMFDPMSSEFYRWADNEFFQKFLKKSDKRERRVAEKTESDESIKENIDRGEKRRALHLKLLNKYRRKAMRMGKSRRRHRRPGLWGIKEKNENRSVSRTGFFDGGNKPESFFASRMARLAGCNLVESEKGSVPENINSVNNLFSDEAVTLPDSPEENEEWSAGNKGAIATDRRDTNAPKSLPLNLPPSPDSDDININVVSGITSKNITVFRKRMNKEAVEVGTPKKKARRNYSQKYESQDLYKPRPILNSSRTRGKERGLERDAVNLDSPISR